MKPHANALYGPRGREEMVRLVLEGQGAGKVAADFGVSRRTVRKWLTRYRAQGTEGLRDRSSRPHRMPRAISDAVRMRIEELRRQRWTGTRIARQIGLSPATVHRVLQRLGLERLRDLNPRLVARRSG